MAGKNSGSNILKEENFELAPSQKESIQSLFEVLDVENTGTVREVDMKTVLERLDYKSDTRGEIDRVMKEHGFDGGADVSLDDLISVTRSVFWLDEVQFQLGEAFKVFDDDGDGYIIGADLTRVMERIKKPLTDGVVCNMMEQADLDGDGKLSFEEFKTIMLK